MTTLKQKPNGVYYLDTMIPAEGGGLRRARIGLDTRDRASAEEQRREWLAGVHPKHPSRGPTPAPKGRRDPSTSPKVRQGMTLGRLLDMCASDPRCWAKAKAQATIRSNVKLLTARIGEELIEDLTHRRLCEIVDAMMAEGYSPASVKRKLDMVSKALRMAEEVYTDGEGRPLLRSKPRMPQIKIENEKDRVLSADEELLVFAAIDQRAADHPGQPWVRFRCLIRVLLDTGFRKGEAFQLGPHSLEQLRRDGTDYTFLSLPRYSTKNGKPRMVPATQAVVDLLPTLEVLAVTDQRTGRTLWFPLAAQASHMWQKVRDTVRQMGGNIDDVTLHTLRHTYITRLAQGGMELQRLSMLAGHSSVAITAARYSHLRAQDLLGALEILDNPPPSAMRNPQPTGGKRANLGTVTLQ